MANTSKEKYISQTENLGQFKWYQLVLPHALAWLTGHKRHHVDNIQWSSSSWSYNIFRVWEVLFWRRNGESNRDGDTIRAEALTMGEKDENGDFIITRHFFTIEAIAVYAESLVREFFKKWRFDYKVVRVPEFAMANGLKNPFVQLPPIFSFAIAYDNASAGFDNSGTTTTFTLAHTITGSNVFLLGLAHFDDSGGQTLSGITWDGAAMTQAGTGQNTPSGQDISHAFVKNAPATGALNMVATVSANLTSSKQMRIAAMSYSGCAQTGQPDSVGQANGTGTTTTISTTVVASNCWLAGWARNDTEAYVAGTGTTERATSNTALASDSNGTVATGSQSLQWTTTGSVNWSGHIISIAPSTSTPVTVTPAALVATFSIPAYSVLFDKVVSVNAQVATFSLPARVVSLGTTIATAVQTATFSIPAYFIEAGNKLVQATVVTATFSIPAYTVAVVSNIVVAVNTVVATFSLPARTIAIGTSVLVAAAVKTLTFTIPAYTVIIVRNITVLVGVVTATFSLPSLSKVGAIWRKIARSTNATWSRISRNSN